MVLFAKLSRQCISRRGSQSVANNSTICLQEVNMRLEKYDELDSLIRGVLFVEANNPKECYYFANPTDEDKCYKVSYDFSRPYPFIVSTPIGSKLSNQS